MLSGLSFLLFLLFMLILGCLGGYTFGFELGGIWGGILGIVIVPLLAVIGGIALIALIGSPLWIVPMLRRTFERFRSTIRQALGRPCSVSSSTKSNKSDRKWEANGDVDMELAFVVSMFSFFGVAGGWMWGEDYGLQHGNGLIQSFWIITGAFLGGFMGLMVGFIFVLGLWALMKILHFPRWIVSRIIRSVKS
jgi:MFS family permease